MAIKTDKRITDVGKSTCANLPSPLFRIRRSCFYYDDDYERDMLIEDNKQIYMKKYSAMKSIQIYNFVMLLCLSMSMCNDIEY